MGNKMYRENFFWKFEYVGNIFFEKYYFGKNSYTIVHGNSCSSYILIIVQKYHDSDNNYLVKRQ